MMSSTRRYKLTFYVKDISGKSYLQTEYFTNYSLAMKRAKETNGWLFLQRWQRIYPKDDNTDTVMDGEE